MSSENPTVDVHVLIPVNEFRFLYRLADEHHTSVGALVAELVHRGLTSKPAKKGRWRPTDDNRLRELHQLHYSDSEIGDRLGFDASTVLYHRRKLGLMRQAKQAMADVPVRGGRKRKGEAA